MKEANKNKIISIFTMLNFFKKNKAKYLQISFSKSWWYDLYLLRYRAKHTEIHNFPSFFALLPLKKKTKIKILKNEKKCWIYHHFTHVYQKSQYMMYSSWDMEWDRHNSLSYWTIFPLFTHVTTQKIKIFKKWKNCLETLSLYTSVT